MDMLGLVGTDSTRNPRKIKSHRRRGSDASAAEWNRREAKYKEEEKNHRDKINELFTHKKYMLREVHRNKEK